MSKGKALAYAILTGSVALLTLIFVPSSLFACFLPLMLFATIFGAIAYAKHRRDQKIIDEAINAELLRPAQIALPPMTSKGSNGRLFVPPPLK